MSSAEPQTIEELATGFRTMPKVAANFIEKALQGIPQAEGTHDYAGDLLWKDEEDFQEVLNYWSSRFRSIHLAKLSKPIETEFQSSWLQYYGAEVVSFICLGPATNLTALKGLHGDFYGDGGHSWI